MTKRARPETPETPKKGEEWRVSFLDALRDSPSVSAAATAAGVGRATAYRHRETSFRILEAFTRDDIETEYPIDTA